MGFHTRSRYKEEEEETGFLSELNLDHESTSGGQAQNFFIGYDVLALSFIVFFRQIEIIRNFPGGRVWAGSMTFRYNLSNSVAPKKGIVPFDIMMILKL